MNDEIKIMPSYYHVCDMDSGKIVWSGYAEDPEQACNFSDQKEHGVKKAKRWKYEKTNYVSETKYRVARGVSEMVTPERFFRGHKYDHFRRVRIKRFPWLGSKIWDIVKIFIAAIIGASAAFMSGKIFQ